MKFLDKVFAKRIQRAVTAATPAIIERATPEILETYRPAIIAEALPAVKAEVVSSIARAMVIPGQTMVPAQYQPSQSPYPIYGYNNPLTYAIPLSPTRRPESFVTVETLERFAASYDVLRACILHLKREVQAQPFDIRARDEGDNSPATLARIKQARLFFTKKGGLGELNETRRHYENKIIEDLLVVGAYAVYKERSKSGKLLRALPFSAKTVRPRMDAYGWPGPGEDWYEQWIQGQITGSYPPDELVYDGMWPETNSPYFVSPVEYLVSTTLTALKSDEWNRSWLTDGNTPGHTVTCPPEWTPEQIIQYSEYFNEMLAGNVAARNTTVFLPGGVKASDNHSRKDQDFKEFDLWLARRTGAIIGVHLAAIGFSGEQYKVTQDGSMDATTQFGAAAILDIRKEHYDDLLDDLGYDDLEVTNTAAASESPQERSERLNKESGWTKINELRSQSGLDPIAEGDVIMVQNTTIPLGLALNPPAVEPSDDQRGSAEDDSQDPDDDDDSSVERAAQSAKPFEDLARWQRKALKRLRDGKVARCAFDSQTIGAPLAESIFRELGSCSTEQEIRDIFRSASEDEDDDAKKKRD